MVDRVGDWYAFSRTFFCRRLTLYADLPWRRSTHNGAVPEAAKAGNESAGPFFSLATAELVAVAPFGGPIAVLTNAGCASADLATTSPPFALSGSPSPSCLPSSPSGAKRLYFNLSTHSAAVAGSRAIFIFTNAGELLASFPLTPQDVGQDTIKTLGWTPEGELFFLLEPSLIVVFIDTRDVAVGAIGALSSSSASQGLSTLSISRRVALRPHSQVTAQVLQAASSSLSPIAALCVSFEGLICVDGDGSGRLYGVLHEEKFRSSLVPSVRLPLLASSSSRLPSAAEVVEQQQQQQQRQRNALRPCVTAVEMVPPAWNDSGDFLVLWAQCDEAVGEKNAQRVSKGNTTTNSDAIETASSALCAMVLPDGNRLDYDGGTHSNILEYATSTTVSPTLPTARIRCVGRVLSLSVCVSDPTRVAAFTSLSVLHIFRSNLSAMLYSIDLGLCRVLRDMAFAAASAMGNSGNGGSGVADDFNGFYSGVGLSSQSFAFGDVPWRQRDDVGSNASFGAAAGASFDCCLSPPAEGGRDDANNSNKSGAGGSASIAVPSPCKLEWCGANFVVLHFYRSDFQQLPQQLHSGSGFAKTGSTLALQRQDAPMFSLLVCTQKGCSVHCERFDWSLDGSGHIVTVAEDDGVRIVSDTTCYFLQEVPPCLAKLCRVQPPFSSATQVVLAYQAYVDGDRHGIAQVRAALSSSASTNISLVDPAAAEGRDSEHNASGDHHDNVDDDELVDGDDERQVSHTEGIVCELLDAASQEFDVDQQYLLVAAASFACETIQLRSGVPDVIVDVVRRLRVLRAVRDEAYCHMPLTMVQYQVLIGSERRPARRLSSSEGSVLVDRLTYMGYYQLALDVARALHMKLNRVLSRWASSFVRRHVATLSDVALHYELTSVLQQYPVASYIEAASVAFHLGRKGLALRLLRDEPQHQQQRVMLCVQMGQLTLAGRAAAASGSAELIHLVVSALVSKEAQTHRAALARRKEREEKTVMNETGVVGSCSDAQRGADNETAGVTDADVYHCLIASPELLCWLLVGAQCLASWQSMAQRLLFSRHWTLASLECQHILMQCLRLTSTMHRAHLEKYRAETLHTAVQRKVLTASNGNADAKEREGEKEQQQKSKKKEESKNSKQKYHCHGKEDGVDNDEEDGYDSPSEGEDVNIGDGDANVNATKVSAGRSPALSLPPPLPFLVSTALGATAALTEWIHKTNDALLNGLQYAEELRRENSAVRSPFSVILVSAERFRAETHKTATQSGYDDGPQILKKRNRGSARNSNDDGMHGRAGAFSSVLGHEYCIRTILSTPCTTPQKDLAALQKEEELSRLKVSLAMRHSTPRLARVVSVVDLIYELCGLEDGEADAVDVQRIFEVNDKMFFYSKLRGMCAAQRWSAVDHLLGPPPPLQKRSFFGQGGPAKAPCIGYLAVVQLLTEYKQEERATRYVAGACADSVDRVALYMSLGAPLMALEAAMVAKDAGLIQQIMRRVPDSTKVRSVGTQMLSELRKE